jgi:hypothetical protein
MTTPTRPRVVFILFFLTGVLVFTIHLRTTSSRVFNQFCKARADQKLLVQELRSQQLRLESLINPRYMFEHLPPPPETPNPKTEKKTR